MRIFCSCTVVYFIFTIRNTYINVKRRSFRFDCPVLVRRRWSARSYVASKDLSTWPATARGASWGPSSKRRRPSCSSSWRSEGSTPWRFSCRKRSRIRCRRSCKMLCLLWQLHLQKNWWEWVKKILCLLEASYARRIVKCFCWRT